MPSPKECNFILKSTKLFEDFLSHAEQERFDSVLVLSWKQKQLVSASLQCMYITQIKLYDGELGTTARKHTTQHLVANTKVTGKQYTYNTLNKKRPPDHYK